MKIIADIMLIIVYNECTQSRKLPFQLSFTVIIGHYTSLIVKFLKKKKEYENNSYSSRTMTWWSIYNHCELVSKRSNNSYGPVALNTRAVARVRN